MQKGNAKLKSLLYDMLLYNDQYLVIRNSKAPKIMFIFKGAFVALNFNKRKAVSFTICLTLLSRILQMTVSKRKYFLE